MPRLCLTFAADRTVSIPQLNHSIPAFLLCRRPARLLRPGLLRERGVPQQRLLPHGAGAQRHPAEQGRAFPHRLLLRAHALLDRREQRADGRHSQLLQRNVSVGTGWAAHSEHRFPAPSSWRKDVVNQCLEFSWAAVVRPRYLGEAAC